MNEYVKNLNRREFVVTMACTGKCRHCSEVDHTNCTGHIDADIAATEMGIPKRSLITNGFFTKDQNKIKEVVQNLEDSGVCKILLSVDAFHQETIPLEPVKYFAECVVKSKIGIKLSPAWLVSEDDNNPYNVRTREIIKEFDYLNIPIGLGNVIFPSGNALKYLGEYFRDDVTYSCPYDEDPRDIKTIGFSPNGDVLDGNVYQKGILDILNEYQP